MKHTPVKGCPLPDLPVPEAAGKPTGRMHVTSWPSCAPPTFEPVIKKNHPAAGPWHDSAKEPPPYDGREILGMWNGKVETRKSGKTPDNLSPKKHPNAWWQSNTFYVKDPDFWAEIVPPKEEE